MCISEGVIHPLDRQFCRLMCSVCGGSEALKIEQVGCNVTGGVAEGNVYCFMKKMEDNIQYIRTTTEMKRVRGVRKVMEGAWRQKCHPKKKYWF